MVVAVLGGRIPDVLRLRVFIWTIRRRFHGKLHIYMLSRPLRINAA